MVDKGIVSEGQFAPSRSDLIEIWTSDYGAPPPKGLSSRLLVLSAAYNAQVRDLGGLRPAMRKRLLEAATAARDGTPPAILTRAKGNNYPTGTRLVREWQGRSHVVDVLDDHVVYNGETYRSLSAVARTITGARWSGPRFFGLSKI